MAFPSSKDWLAWAQIESHSQDLDANELKPYLKNMPSEEWWTNTSRSLNKLEQILNPIHPIERSVEESSEDDLHPITPRNNSKTPQETIRKSSLPWIRLLPSGSFAAKLTATNEPLACLAIGTMGPKLFIELFWEAVDKAEEAGEGIRVYEIQSSVARILTFFEGLEFEIRYTQCETLIRRYPDLTSAPESFLDDSNYCPRNVRDSIVNLNRHASWIRLAHQLAYHYIREYAIQNGVLNTKPGINVNDFIKICGKVRDSTYVESSVSDMISQFSSSIDKSQPMLQNVFGRLESSQSPEVLISVLQDDKKRPLHLRLLEYPSYIRISLLYMGSSHTKGGQWLSMVDRKVLKLKDRLQFKGIDARIWPQRLAKRVPTNTVDVYEGYVILGLHCLEASIPEAEAICERWIIQVREDSPTGQSILDFTILHGNDALRQEDLFPDPRTWPRTIVKPDEETRSKQLNDLERPYRSLKNSKKTGLSARSVEVNESGMKGAKLRSASDVLNRLRYDREYSIDDCVVGYMDRVANEVKEKPAADWASETTHEEFIPEHRIEYFKLSGEVIWDKAAKMDKVFKSG